MVAVPKLRIKFGPEGSIKAFQTFPGVNSCGNAKRIEHSRISEDLFKSEKNQSKKRRHTEEVDEFQAKKKQKLDYDMSSQCLKLLRLLMKHRFALLFNQPVDPVELNIPDYTSVISKPMDLGTIQSKLLKNEYSVVDEFAADVRLTFSNAMLYNPPSNPVHGFAEKLQEFFEAKWGLLKKRKITEGGSKREPSEVDFSRHRISETLESSSGRFSVELPKQTKEKIPLMPLKGQRRKDTPAVMTKTLVTKLRIKKLDQGLGVSSGVKIPSKYSAPTTACKCGSCGRIICICLKSCNSSGSDASSLTYCQVKNTSGSQESESDPTCNGSVSSVNGKNGCVSSQLDIPSNSELKTSFPALPPLPPEKALRAAKLKSQYAETIVKAKHRIVFNQSNKSDIIRIQIEKEQMQRTQREAKAKIEAEMRAAKIATRMRAQAELKQERDRQRLELEKMKIDYDFEQNNHSKLEENFFEVCGCYSLTRTRLLFEEWGLVITSDYCPDLEEMESENFDAMRVDDLEEGEIL